MYVSTHCSCTDGCEPSFDCWELNLGPLLALAKRFIYYFIHKYTVADFRRTRRGSQISLWVLVNHHVVAGI